MKYDTTAINLPKKQLKDVQVGECFSMESPTGEPCFRIMHLNGDGKSDFIVLFLHMSEYYTPTIETLNTYVYMLDAVVVITMLERIIS